MGLVGATGRIYRMDGLRGLFQGHSATLLRIFPYAGVKFMAYDWLESVSVEVRHCDRDRKMISTGMLQG